MCIITEPKGPNKPPRSSPQQDSMAAVLSTPETQTSMPTKDTKASQDPSDMVEFPQTSSTVSSV
ncbi:unnamed protein product, partial [Callosobruchus maculatus]